MRLGQLARKLEIRPIDIVDFLAKKNITIEDGTNTKIEDEHATLVFQHFAPTMSLMDATTTEVQPAPQPGPLPPTEELVLPENNTPADPVRFETAPQSEAPEVIKAPKIELSGLKIIGKIDLPEPKNKLPEDTAEKAAPPSAEPKDVRREKQKPNGNRSRRSFPNPIALQREQEALEAQKKREEELQRQKEKRTQNYLKKVKTPQPTKAAKFIKEQTEQMSAAELAEPPKTWWGKFIKWLTT